jgi:hypothetical protein
MREDEEQTACEHGWSEYVEATYEQPTSFSFGQLGILDAVQQNPVPRIRRRIAGYAWQSGRSRFENR